MPTEWVSFSSFSVTFFYEIHYDSGNVVTSVIRDSNKDRLYVNAALVHTRANSVYLKF